MLADLLQDGRRARQRDIIGHAETHKIGGKCVEFGVEPDEKSFSFNGSEHSEARNPEAITTVVSEMSRTVRNLSIHEYEFQAPAVGAPRNNAKA